MQNNSLKRYVIGDIHGCFDILIQMLFYELKISREDEVYFLGDYIDRGPKSKEVHDLLMSMQKNGFSVHPILGNHDDMMLNCNVDEGDLIMWYNSGGKYTWRSFGVEHPRMIDDKYYNFLSGLPLYYEFDDFIFVHAGLNFENDDPFEDKTAMLWNRDYQYDAEKVKGKRLVTGHTPSKLDRITRSLNEDIICLDGGCVINDYEDFGHLCALELNSMKLTYIKNIEEES